MRSVERAQVVDERRAHLGADLLDVGPDEGVQHHAHVAVAGVPGRP